MGDDIPLAVLSDKSHVLYNYFKQRFAQVCHRLRKGMGSCRMVKYVPKF